jgi:hypothetical protein
MKKALKLVAILVVVSMMAVLALGVTAFASGEEEGSTAKTVIAYVDNVNNVVWYATDIDIENNGFGYEFQVSGLGAPTSVSSQVPFINAANEGNTGLPVGSIPVPMQSAAGSFYAGAVVGSVKAGFIMFYQSINSGTITSSSYSVAEDANSVVDVVVLDICDDCGQLEHAGLVENCECEYCDDCGELIVDGECGCEETPGVCPDCGEEPCVCEAPECDNCGFDPCRCCARCGEFPCECEYCDECNRLIENCICSDDVNTPTGVALAIIPTLLAAGAAIVTSRKRK